MYQVSLIVTYIVRLCETIQDLPHCRNMVVRKCSGSN